MERRNVLAALTGALLTPGLAFAQQLEQVIPGKATGGKDPNVQPYLTMGPFPDDVKKVYFFFLYSCPYCMEHWRGIYAWGQTLPPSIKMIPMPVVLADPTSIAAAASYYAVKSSSPERLIAFSEAAYARSRGGIVTPDTYQQILREMKIVPPKNKDQIFAQIQRIAMLMTRYKVDVTPHFSVCGKYATNSNFTNGDYKMLGQLLNALVSQHLGAIS